MIRALILTIAVVTSLALPASRSAAQERQGTGAAGAAAREAPAHGAGEHAGHKEYDLLPDTSDPQTWYAALWVLIIFLVLLAILYPTAWKNVLAGLKAREQRIRKDIADAEAARTKAEATLKEYHAQLATAEARVREMISSATTEGERIATQIRM